MAGVSLPCTLVCSRCGYRGLLVVAVFVLVMLAMVFVMMRSRCGRGGGGFLRKGADSGHGKRNGGDQNGKTLHLFSLEVNYCG